MSVHILMDTLKNDHGDEKHVKFELKPSTIPGAGLGVFATEDIEGYWFSMYDGKKTYQCPSDKTYAWEIKQYLTLYGDDGPDDILEIPQGILYIDATDSNHWTKYVNCSTSSETENVYSVYTESRKDVCYIFRSHTPIKKGEELFTWYGQAAYDSCKAKAEYYLNQ